MFRVPIESRVGNIFLAILGGIYFVSASAILAYYVTGNWGSNSLTDLVLQGALFLAAVGDLGFVAVAVGNLRLRGEGAPAPTSPNAREHRTTAATAS